MKPLKVTLTLTKKEHDYFMKKASLKNRTFWHSVHEELNKALESCPETEGCEGDKNKICTFIDIPPRLGKVVKCHAKKLGIPPAALIYRIVFAPNIIDVIKEMK